MSKFMVVVGLAFEAKDVDEAVETGESVAMMGFDALDVDPDGVEVLDVLVAAPSEGQVDNSPLVAP